MIEGASGICLTTNTGAGFRVAAIPTFEQFVSAEDAPTTGSKHDSGKPLMGAVPPNAMLAVARVLTFGAEVQADNWRQVENAGPVGRGAAPHQRLPAR